MRRGDIRLSRAGEPERLTGVPVTQNFFPLLGVTPLVGRFFDDAESLSRAPKAVVLGHDFWLRHFSGDRGAQIRTGNFNGVSRNGFAPRISTLRDRVSGRFQSALVVLALAVSFAMLLVCANLANLLLVRASRRRRDIALRIALGAPRGHLIRQMLVESLLLCGGGAALGIGLAALSTFAISRLQGTVTVPVMIAVPVAMGWNIALAPYCRCSDWKVLPDATSGVTTEMTAGLLDVHRTCTPKSLPRVS
jgi:HAMP domain-containing protein